MREFLNRDFQALRAAAMASWREATGPVADGLLADWAEAIAADELRREQAAAAQHSVELEARRHVRRTQEIPEAFLEAGCAPRDVRLWLGGKRQDTAAFRAAREWLTTPGKPFLVLMGAPGTGKTAGATLALLDAALEAPRCPAHGPPRFWNAAEVAMGALLGRAGEERLAQAVEAPVLVLEDLGADPLVGADVWLALLGVVIDARYRREARTVITTNLSPEALRTRYKERIADRLRQCARFVLCDAISLRKAGA